MDNKCFIGIYWGARNESIESCISKIKSTGEVLSNIDDSFTKWYTTTRPVKGKIQTPLNLCREDAIRELLIMNQNYNDIGELIEDLGYAFSVKSENDFATAHVLSIQCGSNFEKIPNSVTLNIGKKQAYEYLEDKGILTAIYNALDKIWCSDRNVLRWKNNGMISEGFSE